MDFFRFFLKVVELQASRNLVMNNGRSFKTLNRKDRSIDFDELVTAISLSSWSFLLAVQRKTTHYLRVCLEELLLKR